MLCYIKPHIFYERNNEDLHIKQVIPLSTAILGGTIEFPLLNGKKITYTLPAGLQNGHTEILRGKGLQNPSIFLFNIILIFRYWYSWTFIHTHTCRYSFNTQCKTKSFN